MIESAIPRAIETLEGTARRLHVTPRQLAKLASDTPLATVKTVPLGRSLGTYRLWPFVGVAFLRQRRSSAPWHQREWCAAIGDVVESKAWRQALYCLTSVSTDQKVAASQTHKRLGIVLDSAMLRPAMVDLYRESLQAVTRHGLQELVDFDTFIVDRIGDDDAVILLGAEQQPFMLPTAVLATAGLDREKAYGLLMATHTGEGIALDAWPALAAEQEWRPDPDLLRHLVDVGA